MFAHRGIEWLPRSAKDLEPKHYGESANQVCLNLLSPVQKSQHRLTAVLAMHEGVTPVGQIAQLAGVSVATVYRWRAWALEALTDDVPGP